jgi:protein TonB
MKKLLTFELHLSISLLLAVVVHTLVLFGLGFSNPSSSKPKSSSLEVVLVQAKPVETPNKVVRIAQANQQASGTADTQTIGKTPSAGPLTGTPRESTPTPAEYPTVEPADEENPPVTSNDFFIDQMPANTSYLHPVKTTIPQRIIQAQRNLTIAKLTAEISQSQRQYTKPPRTHYLDSLSAKSAPEAAFVKTWVEKVERIGNQIYPEKARSHNLSGSTILHVLINQDGSLESIQIGSSSGEPILDTAALESIKRAAPFKPFPAEMRNDYDQLMITRTWVFQRGDRLKTQ